MKESDLVSPITPSLLIPCGNEFVYPNDDTPADALKTADRNLTLIGGKCDQLNDLIKAIEAREDGRDN